MCGCAETILGTVPDRPALRFAADANRMDQWEKSRQLCNPLGRCPVADMKARAKSIGFLEASGATRPDPSIGHPGGV